MRRIFSLQNIFVFLFLVIFPFGQIIRIGVIQPLDVITGAAALYVIFGKIHRPEAFKYLEVFIFVAASAWVFSLALFRPQDTLYGLLYLTRLAAYFYFLVYVWNFAKRGLGEKKLLVDCLLVVSVTSAIFGWIQFLWVPSLKAFFIWGWDEHLYRLVGTFLDPTFLSLIIVFGLIISIVSFIEKRSKLHLFLIIFLLASLAFTYSRAGYLAFFVGAVFIGIYKKKILITAFLGLVLLVGILLLPTSASPVLKFTRSFSAIARVANYASTLKIFSNSPVFGVGYDNLCLASQKYLGVGNFASHSCSGSDSSLLFILATTGTTGLLVFIYAVVKISGLLGTGERSHILISSFAALLVHSLFSNSMFYPWILGWMMILLSVSLGSEVKS